jgi:2-haloacid dehalogenase
MVALTNSAPTAATAQLAHAGLAFSRVFSVDAVRRFKPAPEPYRMVATEMGREPGDLMMVAAHAWDIAGAMGAGLQGAFLARPGQVLDALTPAPQFIARDLLDLADQLASSSLMPSS